MLKADLTTDDTQRGTRVMLAFLQGDRDMLDAVVDEASADERGTPGLLFAVTQSACELAMLVAGGDREHAIQQLRKALLAMHTEEGR